MVMDLIVSHFEIFAWALLDQLDVIVVKPGKIRNFQKMAKCE